MCKKMSQCVKQEAYWCAMREAIKQHTTVTAAQCVHKIYVSHWAKREKRLAHTAAVS